MSNNVRPDPTKGILQASLGHLTLDELNLLLAALDRNALKTVNSPGAKVSVWFSLAVAIVNKCVRASKTARNAVEQAQCAAACASVREQLRAQHRMLLARPRDDVGAAEPTRPTDANEAAEVAEAVAIRRVYELILHRTPKQAEIDIWAGHIAKGLPFHQFLLQVEGSEEAQRVRIAAAGGEAGSETDGEFVQSAYEMVLRRGAHPRDIEHWTGRLATGEFSRQTLLMALLNIAKVENEGLVTPHDGLSCWIMGTDQTIHVDDWKLRAQSLREQPPASGGESFSRFYIKSQPRYLVTAIASLYKGADFIEQFMDNITSQSIFDDYCELVIVDADSPENEGEIIQRYLAKHKGIQYLRMNHRIGIYDAWNVGVKAARGDYLTNTNLDDLRRHDSLELQAAVLDNLDFVDVTYQDFYYSFDPDLSPEQVAEFGYKSNLPVISPHNMMQFNSPHNAPMWRKRLHDELGPFDINYKSAGDYEFWMRCLAAGKTFYKLNDPHVVYYQNPHGLSTRADTRGVVEARQIHRRYFRPLTSPHLTSDWRVFGTGVLGMAPDHAATLKGGIRERYPLMQSELRHLGRTAKFSSRGAR
jgi:hypothetical protein